jgi:FeS assembly SUF system regulator
MLRISKLTDYGTVILACLAQHPQRMLTAAEVAEYTKVGLPTVSKLLKKLQRAGLVSSARGSHGGYQLSRPPSEITAAAILDALEGPFALTECSSEHSHCGIASSCRVGHVWQRVNAAIRRALSDITLAQLSGMERTTVASVPLTRIGRVSHE